MKFPKEYDAKVDLKKVNWEVMKTWIASRVTELLGVEDEVLVGYVYEQLEHKTVSVITRISGNLATPSACSGRLVYLSVFPAWL